MVKSFFEGKGKNNSRLFIAISIVLFLIAAYLIYKNSTDEKFQAGTTTGVPRTTVGRLCKDMGGQYGYDGKQDLCQCDHGCNEGRGGCCIDKEQYNASPTDEEFLQRQVSRGHIEPRTDNPILRAMDNVLARSCSPPHIKCGEYIKNYVTGKERDCQCDKHCTSHDDCCDDPTVGYNAVCKATTSAP